MNGREREAFAWLADPQVRNLAVVGICKNAGKTTLLNHLLALLNSARVGVFSTGIDGEEQDSVFRVPKPSVVLNPGTLFCCDTPSLNAHGAAVTVLESLQDGGPQRPLWLARTELPIRTSIAGPASVRDQVLMAQKLHACGAEKVLIDGSLDRKSISLSPAVDALILLIGASFGPLSSIVNELRRLLLLNGLEVENELTASPEDQAFLQGTQRICVHSDGRWQETGLNTLLGCEQEFLSLLERSPDAVFIPGACTDTVFTKLCDSLKVHGVQLIVRHPECLKLSLPRLERCLKELAVSTLLPFRIREIYLNSTAIGFNQSDAESWRARLRREFPQLPLPDIRELAR